MWIEVAVKDAPSGPFRVIIGGRPDGRELGPADLLDKFQPGLKNFQAVLFDQRTKSEVVLQNEATIVLKGPGAVDAGFRDREAPLQPAEIRELLIPLPTDLDLSAQIRVRLRFRNLPPEFLENLAKKFDAIREPINAQRCRDLIRGLQIFDMATSTLRLAR
jgi:hypothetical protein